MIPRPLNKDLIFIEAVCPMRTAEPHKRLIFGILAFGSAADDALVDVEVSLEAVYMTIYELLKLRDDVNVCVFLPAAFPDYSCISPEYAESQAGTPTFLRWISAA